MSFVPAIIVEEYSVSGIFRLITALLKKVVENLTNLFYFTNNFVIFNKCDIFIARGLI